MGNDLEKNIFSCPTGTDIAWCPGCGNYSLHKIITAALSELGLAPKDVVISSGIGQAAKMPQYVSVNYYNGFVITSYSIHYTKLYELQASPFHVSRCSN